MPNKWFFAGLRTFEEWRNGQTGDFSCDFQIVTKDRVLEKWTVRESNIGSYNLMVSIVKHGNKASLFIEKIESVLAIHTQKIDKLKKN